MNSPRVWAVIAGGGTAGHVLPGLSIGEHIVQRGAPRRAIHYVGSARGVETTLVTEAGFTLTALGGRGLKRRLALSNVGAAAGLAAAFVRSLWLLGRIRPAVVVGLGGYASAACGAAAVLLQIPLVVVEQNAVAGLANRTLGRFAAAAATAFEGTDLPRAVCTGNPVRPEVLAVARAEPRNDEQPHDGEPRGGQHHDRHPHDGQRHDEEPHNEEPHDGQPHDGEPHVGHPRDGQPHFVAVFGGSLGARSINEAASGAATIWQHRDDLRVRHICGQRDFEDLSQRTRSGALAYELVAYEHDMASVYRDADLVVSRAGATTVAELAAAGVPAVLIPLPSAPGDHQRANAQQLADAGAAVMVADAELDSARLVAEVDLLLADPPRRAAMSDAARAVARPDAAAAVVDLLASHAKRPMPESSPRSQGGPA